ncbi:MAG: MMPL family transporter [Eggerthellales bacterium]|nr:MMPL family transporter [Eggerthellales bacterium]
MKLDKEHRTEALVDGCRSFLTHRKLVMILFVVVTLFCATLMPQVKVEYDLTSYLPEDAASVISLNEMEESFEAEVPNAKLYAEGVSQTQAANIADDLDNADGISDIMWLGTVADISQPQQLIDQDTLNTWKTDEGYLFQFNVNGEVSRSALDQARQIATDNGAEQASLEGSIVNTAYAQEHTMVEVRNIVGFAALVILLILLITSNSWFEPVIFLTVIFMAVVMNMGSNIILGQVSFITQLCAAILQLAVSMDYAIVLLHTYRRQLRVHPDPFEAMAHAMVKGFSVVLSSAAVTFFAFLSLTVMRYGIGVNMGIVLAKGIVFSFLTIMFFMPCLTLACRKPLERLQHRYLVPSFDKFAGVCQRIMVPLTLIVVLVGVPSFLGMDRTNFTYGAKGMYPAESQVETERAHIQDAFGDSETWVIMVPEGQWGHENALVQALEDEPAITSVTSYGTVAGSALPTGAVPNGQADSVLNDEWSRIVLNVGLEGETDESFAMVEHVRELCAAEYGDNFELAGNTVSVYDLRQITHEDSTNVKFFSMLAIGLVLAFMFRSLSIPIIILLAIEVSIWINLAIPYFVGDSLNYIGYLVIEAVQLGAAVDYAIIFAREYFDRRKEYADPALATRSAVKHSAITILTSSSILMVAGFMVYFMASNAIICQIGLLIGRGALLAMLIMFMFLPFLFKSCDKLIQKTSFGLNFRKETE